MTGTGSGKSLCFLLPSFITSGVTIVIVPLLALQFDLLSRTEALRIPAVVWDPNQPPTSSVRIVYVTPESVFTNSFNDYITTLIMSCQLDRIVVDECHTILSSRDSFRPKLAKLGELGQKGIQTIYLTATLPPHEEHALLNKLYWNPADVTLLRSSTVRANIRYEVRFVRPRHNESPFAAQVATLKSLLTTRLGQYEAAAKAVIYSSQLSTVEELAASLGCAYYHARSGSQKEKDVVVNSWKSAALQPNTKFDGRVIVATSALGLGVDIPDIRLVVHVSHVYSLEDYSQESGRAGRDGRPAEAIVLATPKAKTPYDELVRATKTRQGIPPYTTDQYIYSNVCKRVILDAVLDGDFSRVACGKDEAPCSCCARPPPPPSNITAAIAATSKEDGSLSVRT